MTVKRRLFLSNLLMIAVPVLIATIVGCACFVAVFHMMENSTYYGVDNEEEFFIGTRAAAELAEGALKDGENLTEEGTKTLKKLLQTGGSRMKIYAGNKVIFDYGQAESTDDKLIESVSVLDEEGSTAVSGNRIVYQTVEHVNDKEYSIYVLITHREGMSESLKNAILFAVAALMIFVLLSIVITNQILTKYVFRRIEEPLDILAGGVREIGKGNLDYRIAYDRADEFQPVCLAFNEMAQRLKFSVEQTRKNEESRKALFAGISHDLRSPLTSIKAYVEGLLDGIAGTREEQKRYLLTIRRKAEDIDRMVQQMFTFSKLEMDEFPMKLEKTDLKCELEKAVNDWKDEYQCKGLALSFTELQSCMAEVDRAQLRRVIRNIMDNSAKYKKEEIGHLYISLTVDETACRTKLEDDGPGVAEEAFAKLFDVFYRTDPARRNPAGGSGLGLAIAAKTIQRMGGTIKAEKGESGGLSVIITLPAVKD